MPSSVQDLMISAELTPMGVVPWLSPELPSHAGINILSLTPNAAEIEPNLTPPRLATEREQVQDIASTTIARLLPLDLNRAHGTVGISLFHEVTKLPLYLPHFPIEVRGLEMDLMSVRTTAPRTFLCIANRKRDRGSALGATRTQVVIIKRS